MNTNFAGVMLVGILAAGGFVYDRPAAVFLAALTAALAFVATDIRQGVATPLPLLWTSFVLAIASWVAIAAASVALFY